MKKLILLIVLIPLINFSQVQIGQDIDGEFAGDSAGVVSLSGDGSIVAIGSPNRDLIGLSSGSVRVFQSINNNWVQLGQTLFGNSAFQLFGLSVSLSNDGLTLAIGAPGFNNNTGKVEVYKFENSIWTQIGQDINGEASNDDSGEFIDLSSSGEVVAISARRNDGNGTSSGHVRVYENISGTWVQIGQDLDGENSLDASGNGLSLDTSGNIVAIGASSNDSNGDSSGHVRIFERQGNVWAQLGLAINGNEVGDALSTVSLSSNGLFLATGASGSDTVNGINSGKVKIYENQNGNWIQIGQDILGEAQFNSFGINLSLSIDGSVVAISGSGNDGNGENSGHVQIYNNEDGTWIQIGQDIYGEAAGDFIDRVDISSDGNTLAIGSVSNDGNGVNSGHVRIYDLSAVLSVNDEVSLDFQLFPNPTKTQFSVQLENPSELQNVNIYNNLGQIVLKSKNTVINTSKLASGVYVVELETIKGIGSKKLIIE